MKKVIIILLSVFNTFWSYSQVDKNSSTGIGTNIGAKMPYGVWGLFYTNNLNAFSKRIEVNIGAGIKESFVFGLGGKFRFYDNSKNIECYGSLNYSYQLSGRVRYDASNHLVDYYNVSPIQYLHYYLSGRLWVNKFNALQLNCGYKQNISGIKIQHFSGPNENYSKVKNALNSGVLIGIDFIVFLKIK